MLYKLILPQKLGAIKKNGLEPGHLNFIFSSFAILKSTI